VDIHFGGGDCCGSSCGGRNHSQKKKENCKGESSNTESKQKRYETSARSKIPKRGKILGKVSNLKILYRLCIKGATRSGAKGVEAPPF